MTDYLYAGQVRLAYQRLAGPTGAVPMVLLHGGGGDGSTWDTLAPRFARHREVFVPELRGMGHSERTGPYSMTGFRDDLLALLDALALDRVVLVGHSLGGIVSLLATLAAPKRVAALVLEECPPPVPLGIAVPTGLPESAPYYDREVRPAVLAALNAPDPQWWDELAGIPVPVLVVAGGPESFLPQDAMARMAARIPAGELITIPAGHLVHPTEPDAFAAAVETFLAAR
ncbi:pimeloyl-ACP methyl ester carboxylesterase [Asanoa ferruginea]|uniref:Pimeloyl-ACP methyl ester carboxylesterase n=1 Tax=Asanoa ferruginea TaxID=53367 RepID=A0A3D9ZBD4_9ACTN|nr:alpha/beta hydrolase [Asanoa ferruginea]REF94736.1 pimeloyl-ACP methyl ester carboxylesterase [Asanoa ferruginea]GIF45687.1 dihydrolipoamide acetyltransferase [Asanoa ferruginea]